jgi:hypothetical protein
LLVGLATILAVALSWKLLPTGAPQAGSRVAPPVGASTVPDEVSSEIGRLRQEIEAMKAQQRLTHAVNSATAQAPPPADQEHPPLSPEENTAKIREARERSQAKLNHLLERETRDPAWSDEQEQKLMTAIASGDFKDVHALEAKCGQSFCRITLSGGPERDKVLRSLLRDPSFRGEAYTATELEHPGGPQTTIYLMRPGQSLPPVEL